MTGGAASNPDIGQADVGGSRYRSDRHQDVAAADDPAVVEIHFYPAGDPAGRRCPGPAQHGDAPALEDILQHPGRVGILTGQYPVAGGDKRHLCPERPVGAGELGAGDTGPDHDQMFGQPVEVVEMAPGENSLTIGCRRRQDPRRRAGGDQHDVTEKGLAGIDLDRMRTDQPPVGVHDPDGLLLQPGLDVPGLRLRQPTHPGIDPLDVNADAGGKPGAGCRAGIPARFGQHETPVT